MADATLFRHALSLFNVETAVEAVAGCGANSIQVRDPRRIPLSDSLSDALVVPPGSLTREWGQSNESERRRENRWRSRAGLPACRFTGLSSPVSAPSLGTFRPQNWRLVSRLHRQARKPALRRWPGFSQVCFGNRVKPIGGGAWRCQRPAAASSQSSCFCTTHTLRPLSAQGRH